MRLLLHLRLLLGLLLRLYLLSLRDLCLRLLSLLVSWQYPSHCLLLRV